MTRFERRRDRIRAKIRKSAQFPRLTVFRSNKHISAQIINDKTGDVILAVNSMQKAFSKLQSKSNISAAEAIGKELGKNALQKKISQVVFDKGGYKYHGRVEAIARKVRDAGVII